ncbi:MAG: hypothetical protein KHX05_03215, partial [Firmicutes bacterium]|nr:hypothetical protein [Bacillota bacterium]
MEAKERIDRLTDQLKEAGYRYYVLDDPTMEDYEYDRLYRAQSAHVLVLFLPQTVRYFDQSLQDILHFSQLLL